MKTEGNIYERGNHILVGIQGEVEAGKYLEKIGYRIINRNVNYKSKGELDIIAMDGTELVIVEVKTRADCEFGHPIEALTKPKIRRIIACTETYIASNPVNYTSIRFDVVCVLGDQVEHIKDAFYGTFS